MTDESISLPSRPGNVTWNYAEQSVHSIDIEEAFAAWVDDAWKAHGSKEYQETEEIFDVGSIVIDDSPDKEMINTPTGQKHMADDNEDYGFLSTPATDVHDQSRQTPSLDSPEAFLSGDIQVVPCAWTGDQPCNSEEGVESAQNHIPVHSNQLAIPEGLDVLRVDTEAGQGPPTGDKQPARVESCSSSLPVYVVADPHLEITCQTGNTFSSGKLDMDQRPLACVQPFIRGGSQLQNNLSVVLNQHTTVQMFSLLSVETQASQLPSTGYERHVSEESSVSSPPIDVSAEPQQVATRNIIQTGVSEDLQVSRHPLIGDQLRLREECTRGSVQTEAHVEFHQFPTDGRQDVSSAYPQAGPGLLTGFERRVREEPCGPRPPSGALCAPNELSTRQTPVGEDCSNSKTSRVIRRRRRHTSATMSMCSECGSSFVRSGSLSRHMTFVHHKCCLCPATFPDICKLAAHLISHSYELM